MIEAQDVRIQELAIRIQLSLSLCDLPIAGCGSKVWGKTEYSHRQDPACRNWLLHKFQRIKDVQATLSVAVILISLGESWSNILDATSKSSEIGSLVRPH